MCSNFLKVHPRVIAPEGKGEGVEGPAAIKGKRPSWVYNSFPLDGRASGTGSRVLGSSGNTASGKVFAPPGWCKNLSRGRHTHTTDTDTDTDTDTENAHIHTETINASPFTRAPRMAAAQTPRRRRLRKSRRAPLSHVCHFTWKIKTLCPMLAVWFSLLHMIMILVKTIHMILSSAHRGIWIY